MTPPKKQDLGRILKFCAIPSRSAPSPPLRRGEVYCLCNFVRRAEQWYKEEAGRQLTQRSREASATGERRQPSRAAKGRFEAGDYILPEDEVDSLVASAAARPQKQADRERRSGPKKTIPGEKAELPTPPDDEDVPGRPQEEDDDDDDEPDAEAPQQSPEACLEHFRARLGGAAHARLQEQRARHERHGIRHTCTLGSRGWDCVDGEYCGHGLVGRCVAWVPKRQAHLRAAVRSRMEGFFASSGAVGGDNSTIIINNNTPERLAELKKARAAALKAETLRRLAELEAIPGAVAADAEMAESPALGRWPASSPAFLREDVVAQRVELAGLVFAVDVCLGEPRVLML